MRWEKLGFVFGPDGKLPWARHSALTPTPILLSDGTLRVYAGFRDDLGRSRVGFVDVDPEDPTRVVWASEQPVLDLGGKGAFDEYGMILGDIVSDGGLLRMYYVGFQRPPRDKFFAFTGLAESCDGGESFRRRLDEPVLGPVTEGRTIRALHTVRREGEVWRAWYAIGSAWEDLGGTPYPRYSIAYGESADGISFPKEGVRCVEPARDEYRIGRPRVLPWKDEYRMFYTYGTRMGDYRAGCATSPDGVVWERRDEEIGIKPSRSGWDSRHLSYLAPIKVEGRILAFYNGNDMGRAGFGCAELVDW